MEVRYLALAVQLQLLITTWIRMSILNTNNNNNSNCHTSNSSSSSTNILQRIWILLECKVMACQTLRRWTVRITCTTRRTSMEGRLQHIWSLPQLLVIYITIITRKEPARIVISRITTIQITLEEIYQISLRFMRRLWTRILSKVKQVQLMLDKRWLQLGNRIINSINAIHLLVQ